MIVLIGAGNNPMVGMTADFAVSIEETVILSEGFTDFQKKTVPTIKVGTVNYIFMSFT